MRPSRRGTVGLLGLLGGPGLLGVSGLLGVPGPSPDAAIAAVSRDLELLPQRREVLFPDSLRTGDDWIVISEDDVLARASGPGFGDLRVVNEAGEVIPAAVIEPRFFDERLEVVSSISARAEGRMLWLDLGGAIAGDLLLEVPDSPPDTQPGVRGSNDLRNWVPVASMPAPPIHGLSDEAGRHFVAIGATQFRHLEIDFRKPFATRADPALTLYRRERVRVPSESVGFHVASTSFRGHTWQAVLELDGPARALGALEIGEDPGLRPMACEGRRAGGGWRRLPSLSMAWDRPATQLWSPFRSDAVRVTVEGADPPNAPVTVTRLYALPLRLAIRPPARGRIWLAYGDSHMRLPDWGAGGALWLRDRVHVASLGPPEPNPHHRPPGFGLEWLKRRPAVLTVLMIAVLAALALIALRWRPSGPEA